MSKSSMDATIGTKGIFLRRKTFCFLAFIVGLVFVGNSFGQITSAPPTEAQALTAPSASNPTQADFFVFVPFPCPSLKYYQQAQAFMDQVCAAASSAHMKVIIVRSCYNDATNLLKKDWWGDQISDLPNHYKKFIDDGTVKLVDQYPISNLEVTPSGFFYRNNKTIWTGILTQDDPAKALNLITNKPADTPPPAVAPTAISH